MNAINFFSKIDKEAIKSAIVKAELNTSGEIRVHIENSSNKKPIERAIEVFGKLKMNQTIDRNGVLIYLAIKNKQFAIIGDEGINSNIDINFWNDVKEIMKMEFQNNNFVSGISKAIELTGVKLKQFFPYKIDDKNELPDDISFNNKI